MAISRSSRPPEAGEEHAVGVVVAEYQFVESLITLYRQAQLQAVGFAVVLYTGVLGLFGSTISSLRFEMIVDLICALLPWPVALLVLSFAVMEVRIIRASRYITRTLSPCVEGIVPPRLRRHPLLQWEIAPSSLLTSAERFFANSTVFVLAIALPALAAAVWHVESTRHRSTPVAVEWTIVAIAVLTLVTIIASLISWQHEWRRPAPAKSKPAKGARVNDREHR